MNLYASQRHNSCGVDKEPEGQRDREHHPDKILGTATTTGDKTKEDNFYMITTAGWKSTEEGETTFPGKADFCQHCSWAIVTASNYR